MSALAALGRLPFAAIPNVQPTTFLVIVTGYVLGPGAGFAVGALAALTSNFFLGFGPWTPWQMVAWGLAGLTSGILARVKKDFSRFVLVTFALAWGYLYGLILNTWHWLTYIYPLTYQTFLAAGQDIPRADRALQCLWHTRTMMAGSALISGWLNRMWI